MWNQARDVKTYGPSYRRSPDSSVPECRNARTMPAPDNYKRKLLDMNRVTRADRPVECETAAATNTTRLAARAQNQADDP